MKWLIAFIRAIIISILLITGISVFNSFMARQMVSWSQQNFMLGALPRFAVDVHNFFVRNSSLINLLIIIVTFVTCFIVALKKK